RSVGGSCLRVHEITEGNELAGRVIGALVFYRVCHNPSHQIALYRCVQISIALAYHLVVAFLREEMTNATRSDERNDEDERQDNQVYECAEAAPKTPAPPDRCSNVDTWLLDYFPSDTKSSHTRHKSFEAASSTECSSNVNPERISSSKPMPLSPATTLEHLPQVVSRELNLKCSVADGNGARGAHPSKCHRSLLAINPEYADAALSDVLVIRRKKLAKWF